MKEKPAKTFDRHQNVIDLLDKGEALNIEAVLSNKGKFTVRLNGRFVAKTSKGPNRYGPVDSPYYFDREAEARDAARSFKGAQVVREES
jgi:hypothetical protein